MFFAELKGFDLASSLSEEKISSFKEAMNGCAVGLIRHAQPPSDAQHVAFSRCLGPLLEMKMLLMVGKSKSRLAFPELIDVGNLDVDGSILPDDDRRRAYNRGNLLWHTDGSFDPVRARYSLLAAHVVPPGGAPTEFADMRAAYDFLSDDKKILLEDLVVEHSIWHSRELAGLTVSDAERASRPPSRHRLVHRHPGSGRKTLYLASHASHVVGMPVAQGRALLAALMAHATQPQFVHRHEWRVGDLVIWDNLATMHRGTPFDDTRHPRDMRRTTVLEAAPA
jgi:alpha-ketoglutarate-dependent 2,4-dichlorophenoxyacetate dioxygenase